MNNRIPYFSSAYGASPNSMKTNRSDSSDGTDLESHWCRSSDEGDIELSESLLHNRVEQPRPSVFENLDVALGSDPVNGEYGNLILIQNPATHPNRRIQAELRMQPLLWEARAERNDEEIEEQQWIVQGAPQEEAQNQIAPRCLRSASFFLCGAANFAYGMFRLVDGSNEQSLSSATQTIAHLATGVILLSVSCNSCVDRMADRLLR